MNQQRNKPTSKLAACFALAAVAGLGIVTFSSSGGDRQTASIAPLNLSLKNWGLSNSLAKSHINAPEAWKLSEGSRDVIVAVIDTGIDADHPSLRENIWRDSDAATDSENQTPVTGRKLGSMVQARSKPYGWNFVKNVANPNDDHGHGTHVAGIIGAVVDAKNGVAGVAHKVSIMAVKYYSDTAPGSVNLRNTVKAIEYAVAKGAKIINYSGGGPDFSEDEYLAIRKAEAAGVLFVAAAGNERQNADEIGNYYYPSAYGLSNIISVAATDINNQLLKSSNWGMKKVDVAAPGENIFSTLPGGKFGYMTGTSQATAFVSGLAALMLAQDPTLKPAQIKELIKASADRLPTLKGKVGSEGRVNAYATLLALKARGKGKSPATLAATLTANPAAPLLQ